MEALAVRRILVVEDEYLIMTEMTAGLEQAGADVVGPAARLEEALRLVLDHRSILPARHANAAFREKPADLGRIVRALG